MAESLASCEETSINAAVVVMRTRSSCWRVLLYKPTVYGKKETEKKTTHTAFDWSANVDTNSTGP